MKCQDRENIFQPSPFPDICGAGFCVLLIHAVLRLWSFDTYSNALRNVKKFYKKLSTSRVLVHLAHFWNILLSFVDKSKVLCFSRSLVGVNCPLIECEVPLMCSSLSMRPSFPRSGVGCAKLIGTHLKEHKSHARWKQVCTETIRSQTTQYE